MANFMQMMQKAQSFKTKYKDLQDRVGNMELTGQAASGQVTCRINGKFELKGLKLDPALVKSTEADMLEDLILAAVNDGRKKAEQIVAEETRKLMQDLGLPPGFDPGIF
jgi:DNA-binding YbaB/EbfC family protein